MAAHDPVSGPINTVTRMISDGTAAQAGVKEVMLNMPTLLRALGGLSEGVDQNARDRARTELALASDAWQEASVAIARALGHTGEGLAELNHLTEGPPETWRSR